MRLLPTAPLLRHAANSACRTSTPTCDVLDDLKYQVRALTVSFSTKASSFVACGISPTHILTPINYLCVARS